MTADPHTINSGPGEPLSAPVAASTPFAGVSRRREGLSGPQTGAEGFRSSVDLPIPVVVTRHQCPFCRITRAKRAAMVAHIGRCWQNPAARACKTCRHYEPPMEGPYPQHPGWPEDCGAGELIGDQPTANCPSWQAA